MSTIVAISTPLSMGGIGIVRLSGEDSLKIANEIFTVKSFSILNAQPNHMYFGEFKGCDYSDNGYLVYFKAPHSFTGEDTVEIQLHGGVRLLDGVVDECIKRGAVMADRGEFTKRAFLNGKLKLSDAEAVIGMINADNASSLRANFRQMKGYLSKDIEKLERELVNLISSLEASLDYPDEMEDEVLPEIPKVTKDIEEKLDKLISSSSTGRQLLNGINVALIGVANAGKSSLLNKLVGKDRAIVTDIAGTTRDVIESAIEYDGVKINFIDTAGLRESENIIEKAGIERSKEMAKTADVVINVLDLSRDDKPYVVGGDQVVFNVFNKCDLKGIEAHREENNFYLSAKYGDGIDLLLNEIVKVCKIGEAISGELIISKRHLSALNMAMRALQNVDLNMSTDCILIDLKECLSSLGEITGNSANEEVINAIFNNFCVGK